MRHGKNKIIKYLCTLPLKYSEISCKAERVQTSTIWMIEILGNGTLTHNEEK